MSQVFIGNVLARLAQSLDDSGNLERVPFVARNTSPKAESALPRLNQWLNRTLRSIVPKTALVRRDIRLIAIKQNLDIQQQDMNSKVIVTLFSLFSELERDLISLRTKEALSAKRARGQVLGKPKGTLQKSKFDQHLVRIKELLSYGLSVRKIARVLGYSSHIALNTYINKRGLHQVAKA